MLECVVGRWLECCWCSVTAQRGTGPDKNPVLNLGVHHIEQSLTIDGETLVIFTNPMALKIKTTSDHNSAVDDSGPIRYQELWFNIIYKKNRSSIICCSIFWQRTRIPALTAIWCMASLLGIRMQYLGIMWPQSFIGAINLINLCALFVLSES